MAVGMMDGLFEVIMPIESLVLVWGWKFVDGCLFGVMSIIVSSTVVR